MRLAPGRIRQRLADGRSVAGIIVFTGSPVVVEVAAAAGLDFVILHGKVAMTLIGNKLDGTYGKRIVERGVKMVVLGTDADRFMDSITRLWPSQA